MKLKEVYEWYCLVVGFAAVVCLTWFLVLSPYHCVVPFEPIAWIRYPEIAMGFSIIPFYINKIFGGLE